MQWGESRRHAHRKHLARKFFLITYGSSCVSPRFAANITKGNLGAWKMLRLIFGFFVMLGTAGGAQAALIFQVFGGPSPTSTLELSFALDQLPSSTPQTASAITGPFASAIIGPITFADGAFTTNIFLGGFNNRIQFPLGTVLASPISFNNVVVRQSGRRIDNNSWSFDLSGTPTPVPEPSSLAIFATGCLAALCLVAMARWRTAKRRFAMAA